MKLLVSDKKINDFFFIPFLMSTCEFFLNFKLNFYQRKAVPTKASDGYFRHYGQNVREVTYLEEFSGLHEPNWY